MTTGRRKYTVGFIGIGKMGLPMASRIAAHGYPLHAYDIAAAAIKECSSRVADARAAKILADAEAKLGGAADHTEIFRMLDG